MSIVKVKSIATGKEDQFCQNKHAGSGAMKEVYFASDRSYVVQIFKEKQDANSMERLKNIVGRYRDGIFNQAGSDYWETVFCWPTDIVTVPGNN